MTFSEAVTGFTGSDVSFAGGTAGGTLSAAVTGGPTVYNVAVTGMTQRGTVVATIPAGGAQDAAANTNTASTSTDTTVTWDRVPTATVSLDPTRRHRQTPRSRRPRRRAIRTATPSRLRTSGKVNGVTKQTTTTTSLTDTFNLAPGGVADKGDAIIVEVTPTTASWTARPRATTRSSGTRRRQWGCSRETTCRRTSGRRSTRTATPSATPTRKARRSRRFTRAAVRV